MVKCGVFFAVRTEFLNIIYTCFGFKGLILEFKISELKVTINTKQTYITPRMLTYNIFDSAEWSASHLELFNLREIYPGTRWIAIPMEP
jgi:hypothetical protein